MNTHGHDHDADRISEKVIAQLQNDAEHLDAASRSRLNRARHQALDELRPAQSALWQWLRWCTPVAVAAGVVAVSLSMFKPVSSEIIADADLDWLSYMQMPSDAPIIDPGAAFDAASASDVEQTLTSFASDDIDIAEDLEFVAWLAATEKAAQDERG